MEDNDGAAGMPKRVSETRHFGVGGNKSDDGYILLQDFLSAQVTDFDWR